MMLLDGLLLREYLMLMGSLWIVWLMLMVEDGMLVGLLLMLLMVGSWNVWLLMLKGGLVVVGLLTILVSGLLVGA